MDILKLAIAISKGCHPKAANLKVDRCGRWPDSFRICKLTGCRS